MRRMSNRTGAASVAHLGLALLIGAAACTDSTVDPVPGTDDTSADGTDSTDVADVSDVGDSDATD